MIQQTLRNVDRDTPYRRPVRPFGFGRYLDELIDMSTSYTFQTQTQAIPTAHS